MTSYLENGYIANATFVFLFPIVYVISYCIVMLIGACNQCFSPTDVIIFEGLRSPTESGFRSCANRVLILGS